MVVQHRLRICFSACAFFQTEVGQTTLIELEIKVLNRIRAGQSTHAMIYTATTLNPHSRARECAPVRACVRLCDGARLVWCARCGCLRAIAPAYITIFVLRLALKLQTTPHYQ